MSRPAAALVLSVLLVAGLPAAAGARSAPSSGPSSGSASLSLIVEPDAGFGAVDRFFASPSRSLDLEIYELADPVIESELAADAARGVAVRVLLDRNGEESRNRPAFTYLAAHRVAVRWASGFTYTHEKAAVADGTRALVMTFNLVTADYAGMRDFGVFDANPGDARAIEGVFGADWTATAVSPSSGTDLLWSPGSESSLVALIASARHTIVVENEEMAYGYVVDALAAAARRGVAVHVVMTGDSEWASAFARLRSAGVAVVAGPDSSRRLYIHAKAVVVDAGQADARAFVGSENFSETSLLANRELGIVTTNPSIVRGLAATIGADFAAGDGGVPVGA